VEAAAVPTFDQCHSQTLSTLSDQESTAQNSIVDIVAVLLAVLD